MDAGGGARSGRRQRRACGSSRSDEPWRVRPSSAGSSRRSAAAFCCAPEPAPLLQVLGFGVIPPGGGAARDIYKGMGRWGVSTTILYGRRSAWL